MRNSTDSTRNEKQGRFSNLDWAFQFKSIHVTRYRVEFGEKWRRAGPISYKDIVEFDRISLDRELLLSYIED